MICESRVLRYSDSHFVILPIYLRVLMNNMLLTFCTTKRIQRYCSFSISILEEELTIL